MKKLFLATLFVVAAVFGFCAPASAAVPMCVLGGPTAMNMNRNLTEGETFVITNRPLVVNLQFRPTRQHPEQVGECMLPSGTRVAQKSGILQWVEKCGNDEVNRNIVVGRIPEASKGKPGEPGTPGTKGDKGDQGDQGIQGIPGITVYPESEALQQAASAPVDDRNWVQRHPVWTAVIGIVGLGIIAAAASGGGGGHDDGGHVVGVPPGGNTSGGVGPGGNTGPGL